MPNYALLIGIDAYQPQSGLRPLTTATTAVRQMAAWLNAQGWVEPAQIHLLCAPHAADHGEYPATRAAIAVALQDLQRAGDQAQPGDRLYFMFVGYAAGNFASQLLLLPQDTWGDAYGDSALPWVELDHWLRGSGFPTQFCFLAPCRADDAGLAEALVNARLPLDQATAIPSHIDQHILISIQDTSASPGRAACELSTQVLHAGLAGAATESVDRKTLELVIRIEALQTYLEQELPQRSGGQLRCISSGASSGNPIIARLGPAPLTDLHVEIQPPEAAAQATVAIYGDNTDPALEERSGPPFDFRVVQNAPYTLIARAPGYQEEICFRHREKADCLIQLRRIGDGVLGGHARTMAELLIQPAEPALPVRLFNSYGYAVNLPPKKPRGYVIKTPPDRYRGVLIAPERNIEREVEAQAAQTSLLALPLDPAPAPRALDRLLAAVDRGHLLSVRPTANQAALIVLAQGVAGPLSIAPAPPGYQQPVAPAQLPADVVGLLCQSYLGPSEPLWLTFANVDGEQHQLLLPLLPGHLSLIGLDGAEAGLPRIEILMSKGPLLRRDLAAQKRILWAQRFFQSDRRNYLPTLLEGLDEQPLALILAGYSAVGSGDTQRARSYAQRLQALAPTSTDAAILLSVSGPEREESRSGTAQAQLPSMLVGLQQLIAQQPAAQIHPLAYLAFQHAALRQIWMIVCSDRMYHATAAATRPIAAVPAGVPPPSAPEARAEEWSADHPADVLLITVTEVETKAVLKQFSRTLQRPFVRHFIGDKTYFYLGNLSGAHTILVQSEMGAGGLGGSLLTVAASIRTLRPRAIIMVGIAFGVDPERQAIGDILVARQILDYELQRVGTGPSGEAQIIPRGERPACAPRMLDRFRSGAMDWKGASLHFGLVLSGAKLIDHQGFRDQLRSLEPEAIGGEMEGAGLYAAAQCEKTDWIMIKAICDYADGHKRLDKARRQETAARNAARFVLHVLRQGGFAAGGRGRLDA